MPLSAIRLHTDLWRGQSSIWHSFEQYLNTWHLEHFFNSVSNVLEQLAHILQGSSVTMSRSSSLSIVCVVEMFTQSSRSEQSVEWSVVDIGGCLSVCWLSQLCSLTTGITASAEFRVLRRAAFLRWRYRSRRFLFRRMVEGDFFLERTLAGVVWRYPYPKHFQPM